jgi:hypothetical protein
MPPPPKRRHDGQGARRRWPIIEEAATRLSVLCDLHTEFVSHFWALTQRLPKFAVAVLAGDIAGSPRQAVHFKHESFPDKPVIVVSGSRAWRFAAPCTTLRRPSSQRSTALR